MITREEGFADDYVIENIPIFRKFSLDFGPENFKNFFRIWMNLKIKTED